MFLSGVLRDIATSSGTMLSYNARQGFSYFFGGDSKLEFSLAMDPALLPTVTIGGWVKPTFRDINDSLIIDPRYEYIMY